MTTETALWTVLPNGIDPTGAFLRATVFVSPRLATGGGTAELGTFANFGNWPAVLDVPFELEFENHGVVSAERDPDSLAPDPAIWELVFPPTTTVGTHEFNDLSHRLVRSFPVGSITTYVENLYRQVAMLSPTAFPSATVGPIKDLVHDLRIMREGDAVVDGMLPKPQGGGMPPSRFIDQSAHAGNPGLAFAQARRFYRRPSSTDPLGKDVVPPEPDEPKLEFHGIVAFLGDYPKLLRRLGLAIDVVIEAGVQPPALGRVRLAEVPTPLDDLANRAWRPWTNYELDGALFVTRSRNIDPVGDIDDGMLRLEDDERFRVSQVDPDGAALNVAEFAANAGRVQDHLHGKQRSMTPDQLSLPALRSTGFGVSRFNRAEGVVDAFDAASKHDTDVSLSNEVDVFAEDVTRGIHVDVLDAGQWRSLCGRIGTYSAAGTPIDLPPDEGFVKAASVTEEADVGQVPADDLYLHESVFGWDGWSLVVKRPGQAILDDGAGVPPGGQTAATPLETSFEPPQNTLPRLRYGRAYHFRARAVDLAGNRVEGEAIDPKHVSDEHSFWRYEPVSSPEVLPRRPYTEGESVLRMVIRSTLGVSTDEYAALERIVQLSGHTAPPLAYEPLNQRHLSPPKTSQQMAELHGMFDTAFGPGATAADVQDAFKTIAERADGTFMQPGGGAFVWDPAASVEGTDLTTLAKGAPLPAGEYVLQAAPFVELPYLPDVFSRGMSLTGVPGSASTLAFRWSGVWPQLEPIRIDIEEGPAGWKETGRVLTIRLPKAELAEIRLSSFLDHDDVKQMAIFQLVAGQVPNVASYLQTAHAGLNWLLTPPTTLVVVHAVEKPLEPPKVLVPQSGVTRNSGETIAALAGKIGNHAKSTGRLDIDAEWTEPIDDPAKPEPDDGDNEVDGVAHVGDFLIERDEDDANVGRNDHAPSRTHELRHDFGDTKHRVVRYKATATTRYREYFPPEITDNPKLITHVGPETELIVPSSRRPDPPSVLYVIPTFTWTHGRSRFPSLPKVLDVPDMRPSSPTVPSRRPTTRPTRADRPPLADIFGTPLDATLAAGIGERFVAPLVKNSWSRRSGGGLRVYLERPWYSSGAGELLGVVLKRQPWLHWAIDQQRGLTVGDAARFDAIRFAEAAFANGLARPAPGDDATTVTNRMVRVLENAATGRITDEVRATVRRELRLDRVISASVFEGLLGALLPRGDSSKYETRWGKDPIWGSERPDAGPTISQFPLRSAVRYKAALDEANADVTVVGHTPGFDPIRRLWYCDIDIDAGDSYTPFVKLGLVRYQPNSIPGHHISRVVMADFAQLMPERVLTHSKRGKSLSVTLRGPGGYSKAAQDLLGHVAADGPAGLFRSRFAVLQLERHVGSDEADLSWTAVDDPVHMAIGPSSTTQNVVYAGSILIPAAAAGERLRVAVREFDILPTDVSQADAVVPEMLHHLGGRFRVEKYRLMYAAHIVP